MDKLEKALQKARGQRAENLSEFGAGKEGIHTVSRPSLPTGTVELDAEVLEKNRIVAHLSKDPRADLFRILRTQVLQAMTRHDFKTLAITSPNYGDGKTTVAINLAVSIALDLKQTVLLSDLDLRKPAIHDYLGLQAEHGLTDFLSRSADMSDCLIRLPFERMSVLPAGKALEHSSELLGSPQMGALATELKTRYPDRLVIYDMPPLLAQDDPLTFLPHVDAFLLVVRDGETATSDVKRSLEILSQAAVIGTILNDTMSFLPPG